ncbi:MAG: amidohydrolase family protein [Dehalococcoidia bacterium]
MTSGAAGLLTTLPGFVNAHLHSPFAPYRGVTRTRPFEMWFADRAARQEGQPTPDEMAACALITGLENLVAGNTAIIDHVFVPQTREHIYPIAKAYEALGLRAWVFVDVTDLPRLCYTREAFPRYAKAIPTAELPEEMQPLVQPPPRYEDQLNAVADIVRGWRGQRVKIGLALSSPVWCSDGLLRDAAALARDLDSPIEIHAEESPVQREVSLAQWGMSGIQRLAHLGVLSERTIVAHVVQIDDADIRLLAQHRTSVSHNPISNLKLQNGVAPAGRMLAAGVNVCLGTDAQASGDSQSLFPVLKFVAALAGLNGLRQLGGAVEETALAMATDNGRRLWFDGDLSRDYMEFGVPIGPYAYAWDDPAPLIAEVYVDGQPRLAQARHHLRQSGAAEVVAGLMAQTVAPDKLARAERLARYAQSR